MKILPCFLLSAVLCFGYIRLESNGVDEHRIDNASIQFYLNSGAVPGLRNSAGQVWITPDSDVNGAAIGAMNTWNSVTTANVHFAPLLSTDSLDGTPGKNVIAFDDNAEDRELVGDAIAVTVRYLMQDGTGDIQKTDIIFNPTDLFSTTLAQGTYDLRSVLTHELGHTLGANHTGTLSATMFQSSAPADSSQSHLSPDDIAFVTAAYPRPSNYGTLSGLVRDSTGKALRGVLISAQDPTSGLVVGGLSDLNDGTFSFIVPPGSYQVWAEPLTGLVQPANLSLSAQQIDTDFQPAFASATATVSSGSGAAAVIVAPAGASPVQVQFAGSVPVDSPHSFLIYAGPSNIPSGQQAYFAIQALGLGTDLSDADLSFIGPVSVVPGSVRVLGTNQYQMTLSVPAVSSATSATMVINYRGNRGVYSGGLLIQPASPVFTAAGVGNVFSYSTAAVAPGEIVAIFGSSLGSENGAAGNYDAAGNLSTTVAGVQVAIDGLLCPIFYVGAGQVNVQIPYEVAGKSSASMRISNGGMTSTAVTVPVVESLPGLFPSAVNPDYSVNSQSNPIPRGKYATLYAVGLGSKQPALATGATAGSVASTTAPLSVSVNGQALTPSYAGVAPGFTGLDQINVQIPVDISPGSASVSVTINGQTSQTIQVWVN